MPGRDNIPTTEDQIENLREAIIYTHNAIRRLEVLSGLSEPPEGWGITDKKILEIVKSRGVSIVQACELLIRNYGGGGC